jgi:asparagine synthase (glutamine-hydrolysing)
MCGITGYWVREGGQDAWLRDLPRSVHSLRQRGPDDSGTWQRHAGGVAFGQTRLSILDLSPLGHQPMISEDGDAVMVFNGEIYNFAEIKADLERCGHRFRGSGDSEVVLAALREWGLAAVQRFIGMFAIALWRESERRLWLIRDRLGVKPLYYAWDGRAFWFGSELKALRAFGSWREEIDREALGEYFQFGYISAPRSIYRRVFKLLPGHWLELGESGDPVTHSYWSPFEPRAALMGSEEALEEELEALFIDAFRYRMVSDVPVGVFLSGGLDSSLVTAILARHTGRTVHTFTVGFTDPRFDESRWARQVADHVGAHHTERILDPAEMARILPRWADLFDEPFGDPSGVPTFLVSRMARESVKVALSADGGDELFSGYSHYGAMLARERSLRRLPGPARYAAASALRWLPGGSLQGLADSLPTAMRHAARRRILDRLEKLRGVLPDADPATIYDIGLSFWAPAEREQLLGGPVAARPVLNGQARSFADHMSLSDLRHYLPDDILTKVDRASMSVALEARVPILDHEVVRFALSLPRSIHWHGGRTKAPLRALVHRRVPPALVERPKQGFAIPIETLLARELRGWSARYLRPERLAEEGVFDPRGAREVAEAALRPGAHKELLWFLLCFERWFARTHRGESDA